MNREAIKTEISNIIDQHQKQIRHARQYAPAKWQVTKLTELGIIDLMPAKFGHSDASAVIEAATAAKTAVMNAYGEGDEIAASKLYKLMNEKPAPEPTPEPDYQQIFQGVLNARDEIENPDEIDLHYDFIVQDNTDWDGNTDKEAVQRQWQAYRASVKRGKELMQRYRIVKTAQHVSLNIVEPHKDSLHDRLCDGYTGESGDTARYYWYLCLVERKQVNA